MSIARRYIGIVLVVLLVSGCATLNPITVGIGLVSYAATGKGLADHAIGKLTHKDCNILGGLFSPERKICEPLGSAAAQHGFKGFFAKVPSGEDKEGTVLRFSESIDPSPGNVAAISLDASALKGPLLRLSDTVEYSETGHTPDRLANFNSDTSKRNI
tara:strand:+ start:243 stop:716 length:474 start_codon:yes stop_codon:yes gene_type:complete